MNSPRSGSQADMAARSLPDLFEAVEKGLAQAEHAIGEGNGVDLSQLQGLISALCAQLAMADRSVGRTYVEAASRLVDSLNRLEAALAPEAMAHSAHRTALADGATDASASSQPEAAGIARYHQVYAAAAVTQAVKKGH